MCICNRFHADDFRCKASYHQYSFLNYFLKYYETDICKYFSEKSLNPLCSEVAYAICCEGVPAGIFLGKKEADGVLFVNVDYT